MLHITLPEALNLVQIEPENWGFSQADSAAIKFNFLCDEDFETVSITAAIFSSFNLSVLLLKQHIFLNLIRHTNSCRKHHQRQERAEKTPALHSRV